MSGDMPSETPPGRRPTRGRQRDTAADDVQPSPAGWAGGERAAATRDVTRSS